MKIKCRYCYVWKTEIISFWIQFVVVVLNSTSEDWLEKCFLIKEKLEYKIFMTLKMKHGNSLEVKKARVAGGTAFSCDSFFLPTNPLKLQKNNYTSLNNSFSFRRRNNETIVIYGRLLYISRSIFRHKVLPRRLNTRPNTWRTLHSLLIIEFNYRYHFTSPYFAIVTKILPSKLYFAPVVMLFFEDCFTF